MGRICTSAPIFKFPVHPMICLVVKLIYMKSS